MLLAEATARGLPGQLLLEVTAVQGGEPGGGGGGGRGGCGNVVATQRGRITW